MIWKGAFLPPLQHGANRGRVGLSLPDFAVSVSGTSQEQNPSSSRLRLDAHPRRAIVAD